jgi:hypothetical protein
MTIQEATEEIKREAKAKLPNSITVWEESGSILLGFGQFVAEITPQEIEFYAEAQYRVA